ncbi:MAG: Uma2 family endonuclease [Acidimicrobiales bacterium]
MVVVAPSRHLFTVQEWDALGELAFFPDDARVELLEGEIIDMSPIGTRHASGVDRLNQLLMRQLGRRALLRVQGPVRLSERSELQPDLAVLHPRDDFYRDHKPGPGEVYLVIEVADSSLAYDRGAKALAYARAGVPEYWVADLGADQVHVLRGPSPNGFGETSTVGPGGTITPGRLPGVAVPASAALGLD